MSTNSESPGAKHGASSESSINPSTSCINAQNESNNAKKKGKTLQVPNNYNDESFYTQSFDSDFNENNQGYSKQAVFRCTLRLLHLYERVCPPELKSRKSIVLLFDQNVDR